MIILSSVKVSLRWSRVSRHDHRWPSMNGLGRLPKVVSLRSRSKLHHPDEPDHLSWPKTRPKWKYLRRSLLLVRSPCPSVSRHVSPNGISTAFVELSGTQNQ
jgi:hypothetical protein